MDVLLQDLRFAFRSLRRSPAFTAVVVAVMALGIGVNTVTFCMVYGVMARPWPLPHFDRVMVIRETSPVMGSNGVSWLDYQDLKARQKSFAAVGGWWQINALVTIDRDPERFYGANVTAGLLPALGLRPQLGRNFTPDEEVWNHNWSAAMISDRIWRERFHADSHVVGRTFRMNGRVRTVVGVLPPGVRWPENQDFFIPCALSDDDARNRDDHSLMLLGRLEPGVGVAQGRAEIGTLFAGLVREHPAQLKGMTTIVRSFADYWRADIRDMMGVLTIAVAFVLLIACANVANLLLARTAHRRREIAVRLALGASRGRVIRQLLTESALLALAGALAGIVLANWGNRLWVASIPIDLPFWMKFEIDGPVLAFTVAATAASALLFGLTPALHATDAQLTEALRDGAAQAGSSRGRQRARSALVVAEVALSLVLLVGAGLMLRSFYQRVDQQRRIREDGVLTAGTLLPVATWPSDSSRREFFDRVLPQVRSLPGVESASLVSILPLSDDNNTRSLYAETGPHTDPQHPVLVNFTEAYPDYFRTLGITLERGRDFTWQDGPGAPPVAIVNESLAGRLWPGQDPIGRRLQFVSTDRKLGWRTVVGVVADVEQDIRSGQLHQGVFAPHRQEPDQGVTWVLRQKGDVDRPASLAPRLRALLRANAPDLPLTDVRSMRQSVDFALWEQRLFISMMGVFAVLALVIAGVGLYGVMAYSVSQRTQEIGIRMALGAAHDDVVRMVVGQSLRLTLLGAGIGFAAAYALTRFMASVLFGVSPTDPPTFVGVALVLIASSLLAAWVPARRATRVDPMIALRCE